MAFRWASSCESARTRTRFVCTTFGLERAIAWRTREARSGRMMCSVFWNSTAAISQLTGDDRERRQTRQVGSNEAKEAHQAGRQAGQLCHRVYAPAASDAISKRWATDRR